mmetsp:Transcript_37601/g.50904  ORF Transcript_37601/g.50904 Transcript_37601/m.50904 type:complete len:165 (-) Transcript_37601:404-898(-)
MFRDVTLLRCALAALSVAEIYKAAEWTINPHSQESEMRGILGPMCGTSDAACTSYARLMAWALVSLSMIRWMCAVSKGRWIWGVGILAHVAEASFYWSEALTVSQPHLMALPNWKHRAWAFLSAVFKPPYSPIHVALLGPIIIAFWLLLSLHEYDVVEVKRKAD